jgi:hypothetical protein
MPQHAGDRMMEGDISQLVALLREEERACDEGFVADVDWLIELDAAFATRRRSAIRRWAVDAGSAVAIAAIGYVIADNAQPGALALPAMVSTPLLIAALVPAFWIVTKAQSLAA